MKKIVLAGIVATSLLSLPAATWRTAVYSGDFTNTANWVNGIYPSDTSQNAVFSGGKGQGDYSVRLMDGDFLGKSLNANVWTGSSMLFDGADVIFRMPAPSEGEHEANVIRFYAGSGRPASMAFSVNKTSTTSSAFAFSNALIKVTNTADKNVTLDLTRGDFSFAGADGTDAAVKTTFASGGNVDDGRDPGWGAQDFVRTYTANLTGIAATFGIFDWYGKALTNVLNVADAAQVKVLGDMTFPSVIYANVDATQTNHATVTSSTLDVGGSLTFAKAGTASVNFEDATVSVAKDLQMNNASSMMIDNGSQVDVDGTFDLAGSAKVRITGGSQVSAAGMGQAKTATSTDDVSVVIDGEGTKVNVSGSYNVGWCGSHALTVSGGELTVGSYFAFGNSTPDSPVRYAFTQTGGKVVAETAVVCRQANSANIAAFVKLDGGVFSANRFYGSKTEVNGCLGHAYLSADGGTYLARVKTLDVNYPFIGGFDKAELGSKGLTISTEYEDLVKQSFTNKVGEAGRLVLAGAGHIRLGKDSYQSELVTRVATLTFENEVTTYAANVIATNGTSVSFANTTAMDLGGLTLGGGTVLTVGPATRLNLQAADLKDVKIALSGTFAEGAYPLLTIVGEPVSAATREAWIMAELTIVRASGKTYNFVCSDYDESTRATVLSLVIGTPYDPVVTDAEDLPASIDEICVLGALAFTRAKDYVLSGLNRLFFENSGRAAITVASGNQKIDVTTCLSCLTTVDVPGGSCLTFAKPVEHGGIDKTGTGVLAFGEDAASELPLGLTLRDGTWKVEAEGARTTGALKIQSPNPSNAVVLATAADTTVAGLTVPSGAIVKTGIGSLTVENADAAMQLYGNWSIHGQLLYGVTVPSGPMDFPADGTPPTQNYSAFNVVEGEMVLRGTGADAPSKTGQYFSTAEVFVGMRSPLDVAAAPGLVIDHAQVGLGGTQRHVFVGTKPVIADTLGEADHPYLTISNKANVTSQGVLIGDGCDTDATADVYPHVTVDDATWNINVGNAGKLELSGGKTCHTTFDVLNGATFCAGKEPVIWKGDAAVTVDGASLFAGLTPETVCAFQFGNNASGTFLVKGDAKLLYGGTVYAQGASKLKDRVDFAFDGGYLDPLASAFAFEAPLAGVHFVALAGGLKLAVPAGGTWTLPAIVEGTGPIVACGEGAVALDGVFTNAFAGAGVFTGGTLRKATVKIAVDDAGAVVGGVPTFDGAAYDGRLTIDLGRTAENPIDLATIRDLTVMKYATTAPAAANLGKLVGTGLPKAYGKFRVEDGKVILESATDSRGMVLIFR